MSAEASRAPIEHPSPHRDRVNRWTLLFATTAAPLIWMGQFLFGESLTAAICFPGDTPMTMQPGAWLQWLLVAFDAVAILVAIAAGLVSYGLWQRARGESEGDPLEVAEGRTRYLAMWGMMASGGFLAAIIFETFASLMVPRCG